MRDIPKPWNAWLWSNDFSPWLPPLDAIRDPAERAEYAAWLESPEGTAFKQRIEDDMTDRDPVWVGAQEKAKQGWYERGANLTEVNPFMRAGYEEWLKKKRANEASANDTTGQGRGSATS